jgi:hypothetical protein
MAIGNMVWARLNMIGARLLCVGNWPFKGFAPASHLRTLV